VSILRATGDGNTVTLENNEHDDTEHQQQRIPL
jgi:hypothetical protein